MTEYRLFSSDVSDMDSYGKYVGIGFTKSLAGGQLSLFSTRLGTDTTTKWNNSKNNFNRPGSTKFLLFQGFLSLIPPNLKCWD